MPFEDDDLSLYWEDFRSYKEEGRTRSFEEVAQQVKEQLWDNEMFGNL